MRRVLTMMTTTLVLLLSGCAGSREALWTSPPQLQLSADQVFGAALTAGEKNSFTIAKANHESGVISMEQTTGGGKNGDCRIYLLVKVTEVEKGLFEVRTKVRTPDLDATMSGIVEKGLTRNFYYYLFRELNIQEPRNKVLRQG